MVIPAQHAVVIVLLAAGEGRRYGGIKQLAEINGQPMVRHAARVALGTGAPVLVVTGAHAEQVEATLDDLPLEIIRHDGWADGIGSSLAAGIRHLHGVFPAASAALLCLADQPLVDTAALSRMLQRQHAAPQRILASDHAGSAGPPALFPRDCFATLMGLSGSRGAHAVLEREADRVDLISVDVEAGLDVDTAEDLALVRERLANRSPH